MVMGKEILTVKLEVVKHLLKQSTNTARGVVFKHDEGLSANRRDGLMVFLSGVSLVGADFSNVETLGRGLHQRRKDRRVIPIALVNLNRRDDVRVGAGAKVGFDPLLFRSEFVVLYVIPADEARVCEAR